MITKQDLKGLLVKYNFDEEQIQRILNKRIKTLLKLGNKENIDKILKILISDYGFSKGAIEGCLYVLTRGKAKKIEEILKVLDDHEISKGAIEGCLYVFARGKAKEIEGIFKILENHEISKERIEGCLYVLAMKKAKEMEETFKILGNNKIEREQIENNLQYLMNNDIEQINSIFSKGSNLLKKYMQLKGIYDKVVSEEEIHNICNDKNIDTIDFFRSIRGEYYGETYEETVKRKKGIYIGKSIPIEKEYINQNAEYLLKLAKSVSKNFAYAYGFSDISELESQALEIIITKCGDITYNIDWNPCLLERAIYKKTFNYLKINLKARDMLYDLQDRRTQKCLKYNDNVEDGKKSIDLNAWDIDNKQETILRYLSMYIEEGQTLNEAIENIADILNFDEEEVLEEISKIREKNNENDIRVGVEK